MSVLPCPKYSVSNRKNTCLNPACQTNRIQGFKQTGQPTSRGGTCTYSTTNITYYIWSKGKVIAEYTTIAPGANPLFKFIYAGDQRIAMRSAYTGLHFYLNDHLGSASVVIDSAGTVKDKYKYRAFGQIYSSTTNSGQNYTYTGKPLDEEAGLDLHYYGARYYDGFTGRFCAVDPLAIANPELSSYIYTGNEPISYIDAEGMYRVKSDYIIIQHEKGSRGINPETGEIFYYEKTTAFRQEIFVPNWEKKKSTSTIWLENFAPFADKELNLITAGKTGAEVIGVISQKYHGAAVLLSLVFSFVGFMNDVENNYQDPDPLVAAYYWMWRNAEPCKSEDCVDQRIREVVSLFSIEDVKKNGSTPVKPQKWIVDMYMQSNNGIIYLDMGNGRYAIYDINKNGPLGWEGGGRAEHGE